MLKGILFWRWAGGDPTIDISSDNEATTLGDNLSQNGWFALDPGPRQGLCKWNCP